MASRLNPVHRRPVACLLAAILAGMCALTACSQEAGDDDSTGDVATADGGEEADAGTCSPDASTELPPTIGGSRPAKVVVPKDWDGCAKYPLVVMLHGFTATALLQDFYLGLSQRVDERGFVLLLPQGTKNQKGQTFWNATSACCDFGGKGIDDVGYLRGLIKEAVGTLPVDSERVFLVGHSNGGFMGYRMACEAADMITGVASIAGAVTRTEALCTPSRAVHILQIHGTKDSVIEFEGDPDDAEREGYPSAADTVARWRKLNKCPTDPVADQAADFDSGVDGDETTLRTWQPCAEGTSAALWTMKDASHIPGINNAFKDALLDRVLSWQRDAPK